MRRITSALAVVLGALSLAGVAAARGPAPFVTGFTDPLFQDPSSQSVWLDRAVSAGARIVLLRADWSTIAAKPPAAGSNPADPANSAYNWGSLDGSVRAATSKGLTVALAVVVLGGIVLGSRR